MDNSIKNNINFCGQFALNKRELSKLSILQKAVFLKQKDQIIDEFCNTKTGFTKSGDDYIVDIRDEKEAKFLNLTKRFGLNFKKI